MDRPGLLRHHAKVRKLTESWAKASTPEGRWVPTGPALLLALNGKSNRESGSEVGRGLYSQSSTGKADLRAGFGVLALALGLIGKRQRQEERGVQSWRSRSGRDLIDHYPGAGHAASYWK